jgi:putative SOS response-associated peptidase YedK
LLFLPPVRKWPNASSWPKTPLFEPRYNIAPKQAVAAVRSSASLRNFAQLRWGLIPSWSSEPKIAYKLINARAETVADKPSFRSAFKQRRCLILASAFYEWQKTSQTVRSRTTSPIPRRWYSSVDAMTTAGLWTSTSFPDWPLASFSLRNHCGSSGGILGGRQPCPQARIAGAAKRPFAGRGAGD